MPDVILQNLVKHYGSSVAVEDMSMTIRSGELIALLGPSGCGKTTTLRMIGGFIDATSGNIRVGGRDVTSLPPNKRNMGFVFQNYALFPHMSVAQNVAFGLEMRKMSKADVERKVVRALERVRLHEFADRLPKQLSGGQQQRVALARALVIEPDVLLLDEPLSNLDATLRHQMKIEIRQLQQSLGLTTILVTHDQDEAISTADRMVVMRKGRVEQIGAPDEVFNQPASHFVATFMGVSNTLTGRRTGEDRFEADIGISVKIGRDKAASGTCVLALRPESISLSSTPPLGANNHAEGRIEIATYHGTRVEYQVAVRNGTLVTRMPTPSLGGPSIFQPGTPIHLSWPVEAGMLIQSS